MWTVGYLSFRGGQGNAHHQCRLTHLCCSAPSGRLTMLPAFTPSFVGTAKCKQFKSCTDRLGPAVKSCICIYRQGEGQIRNQMGQDSLHFLLLHNLSQMNTCCSQCACAHIGTHTCTHLPLAVPSPQTGCSPDCATRACIPVQLAIAAGWYLSTLCSDLHFSLCDHITPHDQFSFTLIISSVSLKVLLTLGQGDSVGVRHNTGPSEVHS